MKDNRKPLIKAFLSYIKYPKIDFESYEQGEKIILLLRAHPFTQLGWIFNTIIFVFILIIFNYFFNKYFLINQIILFNFFAVVFIITFIWINFLDWYFNVGIITNKKVVDIDFHGIIYKEITIARLNKIEDITIKSGGYFGSLLNFGTVFIQTAGSEANIEFENISYPNEVGQQINNLLEKKHGV